MIEGKGKQMKHYVELGSEEGNLMNAWITDIIHEEVSKHNLEGGDVYIMPLGKRRSRETGYEYWDFVVLQDNEIQVK